jgi:hypothetical protein
MSDAVFHYAPRRERRRCLPPGAIDAIVRQSRLFDRSGAARRRSLHEHEIVSHEGTLYKVRAYPTALEAARRLAEVREAPRTMVRCLGRSGRLLVMEYLPERTAGSDGESLEAIGRVVARLGEPREVQPGAFSGWCETIARAGLLPPETLAVLPAWDPALTLPAVRWSMEYVDPRPENFVVTRSGRFVAIDEQHLCAAPLGASVAVALAPDASPAERLVAEGYRAARPEAPLDEPSYQRLVVVYRCVRLLAERGEPATRFGVRLPSVQRARRVLLHLLPHPRVTLRLVRILQQAWAEI